MTWCRTGDKPLSWLINLLLIHMFRLTAKKTLNVYTMLSLCAKSSWTKIFGTKYSRSGNGFRTNSIWYPRFFLDSYCADFTMDVIARTAFGLQIDSQTGKAGESEFVTMAKKSMDFKLTNPMIICASKAHLYSTPNTKFKLKGLP